MKTCIFNLQLPKPNGEDHSKSKKMLLKEGRIPGIIKINKSNLVIDGVKRIRAALELVHEDSEANKAFLYAETHSEYNCSPILMPNGEAYRANKIQGVKVEADKNLLVIALSWGTETYVLPTLQEAMNWRDKIIKEMK